ncbi:MAG: isochorismatase family cysteine hydrolase [Pseudomonadota bacterium]
MKSALIVIDMQNGFLHPDGENHFAEARRVIDPALQLIEAADRGGHILVHVADRHRQGFTDFEQRHLPAHCMAGTFHAAFSEGFGPQGRRREIAIEKRRYSAFFGTDLALFLREQDVSAVTLCGVKTNVCVRSTAQDAFAHGFDVRLVREAVATNRAHLGAAALEDIDRYFGQVVLLAKALEDLAGAAVT